MFSLVYLSSVDPVSPKLLKEFNVDEESQGDCAIMDIANRKISFTKCAAKTDLFDHFICLQPGNASSGMSNQDNMLVVIFCPLHYNLFIAT